MRKLLINFLLLLSIFSVPLHSQAAQSNTANVVLLNRKDQLLKAAYYEVARNGAKVVNYLAESVVSKGGKTK